MNMADFNWVDFTILGILCFSTLISLVRGFVREAISLATWIVAIWVAYKYGHDFGQNMLTTVGNEQARYLIGAGILFFAVLILGALVNFVMSRFLFLTGLSAIDRILGIAFGFARGILLVGVLILVGQIMQLDKNAWWAHSQVMPQFADLSDWLKSFVPEQFEKLKPTENLDKSTAAPATTPEHEQSTLGVMLPSVTEVAKQKMQDAAKTLLPSSSPASTPATSPTPSTPPAATSVR